MTSTLTRSPPRVPHCRDCHPPPTPCTPLSRPHSPQSFWILAPSPAALHPSHLVHAAITCPRGQDKNLFTALPAATMASLLYFLSTATIIEKCESDHSILAALKPSHRLRTPPEVLSMVWEAPHDLGPTCL